MLHILKYGRVGHEVPDGRVAVPFKIIPFDAACHEQLGHQIVRLEIGVPAVGPTAPPMPGLFKDGLADVEKGLHPASLCRGDGASKGRCGNWQ